jgi:uncharacterized protein YbjT (DUF2867 family)
VYSVQISAGTGSTVDDERRQGKALIDESIKHGVRHFVYSSVERGGDDKSWNNATTIPHFQSKHDIELYLRDSTAKGAAGEKMGWTILRPVAFMDTLVPGFTTKVFLAALRYQLGKDKPLQWVATSDIGVFAAKAFDDSQGWNHRAVGLAGDELTMDQLSDSFKKAVGYSAPETYWFVGAALSYMVGEVRAMTKWFADEGYGADIEQRRREHPALLSFEEWLKEKHVF